MPLNLELPEGWYHEHLASTGSTMADLRQAPFLERNEPFVLVSADFQTAGRGQRGTHWEAEAGRNLLFGIRCHPTFMKAGCQFLLSEVQALAVVESLESEAEVIVKWPNDIYVGDGKLGGMLLEHDLCGAQIATTITGVGLNINQERFSGDAPNPVSLRQIVGRDTDRSLLLSRIVERFDALYAKLKSGHTSEIHETYLSRLYRRTGFYPYADAKGQFEAEFVNVSHDGRLYLRDKDGTLRTYAFKEVRFIL